MRKETPIVMPTEMVTSILRNQKTQHRIVINKQPNLKKHTHIERAIILDGSNTEVFNYCSGTSAIVETVKCFFGKAGDIIWVKETYTEYPKGSFKYKLSTAKGEELGPWKQSISMPKEAARIWLEITNIRVERLHDISESDAIAEGIQPFENGWKVYGSKNVFTDSAIGSFSSYWQFRFGSTSLKSNPWVWVIEFKRIEKP